MHIVSVVPASEPALAQRLLAMQRAAYAIEAELIGDNRLPGLHETIQELCNPALRWLVAQADEPALDPLGAVAWFDAPDLIDIDRLVVAPSAQRRGIGRALVSAVIELAADRRITVSTGRDNLPACALYQQLGFHRGDDQEVLPGLWITHFTYAQSAAELPAHR